MLKRHFDLASSYLGISLGKECQILHYSVMQRLRAFWTVIVEHIATFLYPEGMYLGPCPSNRTSWAVETASGPLLKDRHDSDQPKNSPSSDGLKGKSTTKIKYSTWHCRATLSWGSYKDPSSNFDILQTFGSINDIMHSQSCRTNHPISLSPPHLVGYVSSIQTDTYHKGRRNFPFHS